MSESPLAAFGLHSSPNIWDESLSLDIPECEPGVRYFVAALRRLGCTTFKSCEGHPRGFYILFRASYRLARLIQSCGFFMVALESGNLWSLRRHPHSEATPKHAVDHYRWAAEAWERGLFPVAKAA